MPCWGLVLQPRGGLLSAALAWFTLTCTGWGLRLIIYLSIYLSIDCFIYLPIYLFIYLSVCLSPRFRSAVSVSWSRARVLGGQGWGWAACTALVGDNVSCS